MGALGEYPKDEMLRRLKVEVAKWEKADPSLPVQPALHLVAVVAQGEPGKGGKYRMIMPDTMVNKVYGWAKEVNGILFIDIQTGHSDIRTILPRFEWMLKNPDVHLGIDPEFNLIKSGRIPCKKIGTYDAADINYAAGYLAELVKKYNLPPKVFIVHRFTRNMVTNAEKDQAPPRGADRHGHGRLGRPLAEAGFLPGLHRRRPGAVHRLQALLSQRHQERRSADDAPGRAEAQPEAALHPVPVRAGRRRRRRQKGKAALPGQPFPFCDPGRSGIRPLRRAACGGGVASPGPECGRLYSSTRSAKPPMESSFFNPGGRANSRSGTFSSLMLLYSRENCRSRHSILMGRPNFGATQ